SVTPDMFFPATACLVQDRLGAKRAWGFDLSAACSGFAYALTVGAQFVGSGAHRQVVVIGSAVMSWMLAYPDGGTCVVFGDGAGGAAPGEFANYSRHAATAGPGRFQGDGEYRQVRKHDRRHDSAGFARRGGPGAPEKGRPRASRCRWCGLHDRWIATAMGLLA